MQKRTGSATAMYKIESRNDDESKSKPRMQIYGKQGKQEYDSMKPMGTGKTKKDTDDGKRVHVTKNREQIHDDENHSDEHLSVAKGRIKTNIRGIQASNTRVGRRHSKKGNRQRHLENVP